MPRLRQRRAKQAANDLSCFSSWPQRTSSVSIIHMFVAVWRACALCASSLSSRLFGRHGCKARAVSLGLICKAERQAYCPRDATVQLGEALWRCLQPIVGLHEVLLVEWLVAGEASQQIGLGVGHLVGAEGLIFPLAVTLAVRIFGTPAGPLLHHGVADNVGLDEAAVGILLRVALGVELGGELHEREHGAVRQRLPLLGGIDRGATGVELAILFDVGPIEIRIQNALAIGFRKGDLVAAGADRARDRKHCRGSSQSRYDNMSA